MSLSADFSTLLRPISQRLPVGESVRYDPAFDAIKHARINEDESLSQGVWEAPLVKADWSQVSELCQQLLSERAKDLQVAVWLADAWAQQDGLEGMTTGVRFVTALSAAFWDSIYPCDDDSEAKHEARIMIYEWFRKALVEHLHDYPIARSHGGQPVNLLAVQNAERLQDAVARSKNPAKLREKAKARSELFKADIDTYLKVIPQAQLAQHIEGMQQLKIATKELAAMLDEKLPGNTLSFSQVYSALDDLARLLVGTQLDEAKVEPVTPVAPVIPEAKPMEQEPVVANVSDNCNSRAAAYAAIGKAVEYLEVVEPHSPTPHVLKKVLQWEKQSLAEIFAGFGNSPQDFVTIASFIGLAVNKESTAPSTPAKAG